LWCTRSLLYPCFKTALCYGVVSGCFVHSVSPSSRTRSKTWPSQLCLERLKVRAKSMQNLLGHNAAWQSRSDESADRVLDPSKCRKINFIEVWTFDFVPSLRFNVWKFLAKHVCKQFMAWNQDMEIQVLLALNEPHRSSVQTIAACMPLTPTYDLHVVQFYETVAR